MKMTYKDKYLFCTMGSCGTGAEYTVLEFYNYLWR